MIGRYFFEYCLICNWFCVVCFWPHPCTMRTCLLCPNAWPLLIFVLYDFCKVLIVWLCTYFLGLVTSKRTKQLIKHSDSWNSIIRLSPFCFSFSLSASLSHSFPRRTSKYSHPAGVKQVQVMKMAPDGAQPSKCVISVIEFCTLWRTLYNHA